MKKTSPGTAHCPDLRGKAQPASEQDFQASQATHTHSTNMERRYSAAEKIVEERAPKNERGAGAPGATQGERS